MYSLPFNPPPEMIPLNDPFVQFFGSGKLLTKDFFFSGHTATLFLLFLVIDKKPFKQLISFILQYSSLLVFYCSMFITLSMSLQLHSLLTDAILL